MPDGIVEILDDLHDTAASGARTTVDDVAEAFGRRGAAPFLIVPAMIGISPLGGVPGVPTFLATLIALVAAQIAFGRTRPWIPDMLGRRGVSSDRLAGAVRRIRPVAERVDGWVEDRWHWASNDVSGRIAMAAVLALCLTVPPLEFLPFAALLPLAAILLFGVALLVEDGVVMILAFLATAGVAIGAVAVLSGS